MAQATPADSAKKLQTSKLIECVSHGSLRDLKALKKKKTDLPTVHDNGTSLIHYAVANPKTGVLEYLIRTGSPVETRDKQGRTPLLACIKEGTLKNMLVLIGHGAEVRARDRRGATALHYAAVRADSTELDQSASGPSHDEEEKEAIHNAASDADRAEIIDFLLKEGLSINSCDFDGRTPLLHCSKMGSVTTMKILVDKGANIKAKDHMSFTALHLAAENEKTGEITKFLLEQGFLADERDDFGYTALHHASMFDNLHNVKLLVEKGANVKAKAKDGVTPLHMAAAHAETTEILQYLLDKGARVNAADKEGITPVLQCASQGNAQKMKFLVEKGANILTRADDGITALHFASANKKTTDTMQYLLDQGMPLERRDQMGRTPLLFSATNGNLTNVEFLCEKGANLNALCKEKGTALHAATFNPKGGPIIKYLLAKGIPVNVKDGEGRTPLIGSQMSGIVENERILRENGAHNYEFDPGDSPETRAAMLECFMISELMSMLLR